MKEPKEFFKSRPWKVFLVTFSISFPIFVVSAFQDLFLILVLSMALTIILRPVIDYLENIGMKRTFSILALYVVFGSVVVVSGILLYPIIITQIIQISTSFSGDKLTIMLNKLSDSVALQVPFMKSDVVRQQIFSFMQNIGTYAGETISGLIGMITTVAIVPFISFFLLNDYYKIQKAFIHSVPNKYFEMSLNTIHKLEEQLTKYIRGTVTESLIVSIIYAVAYYYLGIKYATILGFIGGVTNIIPFAGPFIGGIPVLLATIMQFGDLSMLVPIIITTIIVQQLDQIFVQPAVFSKIMDIHPLTMFLVILAGNEVLGVIGMILAVPLYTVISVTARETNWGLKHYKVTWL